MDSAVNKRKPKGAIAKFWIGIGASAGGLEALRGLVRNLPPNVPAAYIVAQHMAPQHKSMLTEIIGRDISLKVVDVTDNVVPRPNVIYITPPNRNIIVDGGKLRLVDPSREPAAPKPSVDTFFKTLGAEKGKYSIGIILSGTGSDGAIGTAAIRAAGGVMICQDELTAKYSGMPVSAMETGCIDLVMSPEEIGAQLPKILKMPRDLDALRASPLSLDGTAELVGLLLSRTKVNFLHYKTATFQRRVERRMASRRVETLDEYVEIAKNTPEEIDLLFKELLISVTSFFRDPHEFDSIRGYIAKIVKAKKGEQIRVWVAGSATGQEAYSLAMVFAEAAQAKDLESLRLQIFATDIDMKAIEVARRGFYSHAAMEQVPTEYIQKYFDRAPTGYIVKKSLREKIVFSYHNISQDPPFLNIDMISCRNLLIYFQASLQAEVFARFHYSLVPGGLLFLGKAEAVTASEQLFRPADKEKHIFFQRPSGEKRPPREALYQTPFNVQRGESSKIVENRKLELIAATKKFDSLVNAIGPNAILLNADLNIVRVFGNMDRYAKLAAGAVDTRVATLLRDPYRQDIQAATPGVIRKKQNYHGIARSDKADCRRMTRINIYPVDAGENQDVHALVVFAEWHETLPSKDIDAKDQVAPELARQISELGNELATTKENLQQTVEELETSNEEMQALNEELQSSNEELQSTNEELETSNEELQSTNEELSTVNEELQVNAQQLNVVNQSLSSILENISIPLLVVDRGLVITNASKVSETYFKISPDIALPHVSRCRLRPGFPDLMEILEKAMMTGSPCEAYVETEEDNAILSVVPHLTSSGEIIGAIVLINDNTAALTSTRNELQLIFDNVPAAIMVRDQNGTILRANRMSASLLESTPEQTVGSNFFDYFDEPTRTEMKGDHQALLTTGLPQVGVQRKLRFKSGKEIWAQKSLISTGDAKRGDLKIYSMLQDVTEAREDQARIAENEVRLAQATKASKAGVWDWNIVSGEVYWSPELMEIMKIPEDGFGGAIEDGVASVHPDDLERVISARDDHLAGKCDYNIQHRLMRSDGVAVWVHSYGQAIWDENGTAIRMVGASRDITEEREIQNSVAVQKDHLELAIALSSVGHWEIDPEGKIISCSSEALKILGVSEKDGHSELESAYLFYHPDDLKRVKLSVRYAIKTGRRFTCEARLVRSDGEVRKVKSSGMPTRDPEGNIVGIFIVFQDITEIWLREEELAKSVAELGRSNEELNRFSYVCSHDMKEPVRMIESMTELLTSEDFEADDKLRAELIGRIGNNTARLRAIIDSLLAYSRIDAKITRDHIDLNDVVHDVLGVLSLAVKERKATVKFGKLPKIYGARVHFMQIFQNLIGNSLKYSDKDEPLIELTAEKSKDGWTFRLEDNGPGIPEKSRTEIFQLFSRLERRDEIDGTGLGLSIVQKIVLQYHGKISCEASELGGAAFVIWLPSKEVER
ncbi:CheR family methyltransferase [Hoeflea sp. AS60]|uniref:CheR family methyltransferase n=1 Tax=Hoeflea sp. AS60 TaxID=3135780 RepID=UPI00316CDF35